MRLRGFLRMAGAVCLAAACLVVVRWMENPYGKSSGFALCAGREYYLYSPSSQAKIVKSASFAESFYLTGEKSVFLFPSDLEAEKYVCAVLAEQHATIAFEEEVLGGRSIYAYAPKRGGGVLLSGQRVNLHLVLRGSRVCVGTPIIFGGY